MINLDDDDVVHVNYEYHGMVMIDLEDNVVIHLD